MPLPVIDEAIRRLEALRETHPASIEAAATIFADVVQRGGLIHAFGAGHSHLLAEEVFFRAGGLLAFNAMLDPALMLHVSATASGEVERITEYAHIVFKQYSIGENDAMLVISYSGINAVPVEMARIAKAHGLQVVALTSVQASQKSPSRHPSGLHLYEIADVVLDNPGPVGDASVQAPGSEGRIAPLSTVLGAAILQSVVYAMVEKLAAAGAQAPIVRSINVPDYPTSNDALIAAYWARLRHL